MDAEPGDAVVLAEQEEPGHEGGVDEALDKQGEAGAEAEEEP